MALRPRCWGTESSQGFPVNSLDVEAAGSSFDKYLQTNLLEISESLQALKLYYEVATMSACETQKNCSMMGCLRLQRIDLPQMDAERNRGNPLLHGHFSKL